MADKIEYSRLLLKRTNIAGEVPTIPPTSAVTLNQFTPTDIFVGEMYANVEDDRLWYRTNNGIVELNVSGSTGTTVVPTLTQVLNEGNTTGGFDISVSSGNTIIFGGLTSGGTSQYLGLDADGRTIIVTGATGGSGTSGTSGINGTSGSSGIDGTSGSSGVNGSNGSSGTSGISPVGLYLPLSGGTVTGNTYFGLLSGITIDQTNNRLGINTSNPSSTIEAFGTNSKINYDDTAGGVFQISGDTFLPRFSVAGAPSISRPLFSLSMGVRTYDDVTYPGYGKVGDGHLYASNEMNGLNIINRQSSGTSLDDYIRFYAGQDANGTTPDIHIQGSGSTRGYVGIGTANPTEKLHVVGNTRLAGEVYLPNVTSGLSTTFLTIDPDTKQITTATSGAAGSSGSSGTSGADGSSGSSGTSGISGSSGSSGTSGADGSSGSSGTSGISGSSGTSGISGSSGTSGANGSSGSSGTSGANGSGFTWAGEWSFILEPYAINSVVEYDGSSYIAITGNGGADSPPNDPTNWALMAQAGTSGSSGINGTSGTSGVSGTSGSSGVSGTSGSSGVNGTSGTSGVNGTSGTSGIGSSGTSGLSGVNGTSGTSGISGSQDLETTLGIGNTTGANNILFDTGYYIANDNLFGNTNQIIPEGADGKLHLTSSSGSDVTDISANPDGINLTTEQANVFVGSNPLLSSGVVIDIYSGNSLVLNGITSGASTTFLTIDPDTKEVHYTSGSTGGSGTSGTSGTSGGGGGGATGTHFAWELSPNSRYNLSLTSEYHEIEWNLWANQMTLFPFTPARDVDVSGFSMSTTFTAGTPGTPQIVMCAYDHNPTTNLPGNLILSSSTITLQFPFVQHKYTTNYTFSAGTTYWLGYGFNNMASVTAGFAVTYEGLMTFAAPNTHCCDEPYKFAINTSYTFPTLPDPFTGTRYTGNGRPPEICILPR
jgi:collagen type VII alpha